MSVKKPADCQRDTTMSAGRTVAVLDSQPIARACRCMEFKNRSSMPNSGS